MPADDDIFVDLARMPASAIAERQSNAARFTTFILEIIWASRGSFGRRANAAVGSARRCWPERGELSEGQLKPEYRSMGRTS